MVFTDLHAIEQVTLHLEPGPYKNLPHGYTLLQFRQELFGSGQNEYTPLVEVNQAVKAWSFRQSMQLCWTYLLIEYSFSLSKITKFKKKQ